MAGKQNFNLDITPFFLTDDTIYQEHNLKVYIKL